MPDIMVCTEYISERDTLYLRELTVMQQSSMESCTFEKVIKESCLQEQRFKA